jgi:adenylosuccinate synthase
MEAMEPLASYAPEMRGGLILALSGAICSGKTTVGDRLAAELPCMVLRTREVLSRWGSSRFRTASRRDLQDSGTYLDMVTKGGWIAGAISSMSDRAMDEHASVVVDAIRSECQLHAIRSLGRPVLHVHLTAPRRILERRYRDRVRRCPRGELAVWTEAQAHPADSTACHLCAIADVVVDTGVDAPVDTVALVRRAVSELQSRARG